MRRSSAAAAPTAGPPTRHRQRLRPFSQVETVHRAGGGADDELIVERAQPGGRAFELTRPVGAAGGQRQRDDAAVGEAEIQRVERRHRRGLDDRAERHLPQRLTVSGAERDQISALQ